MPIPRFSYKSWTNGVDAPNDIYNRFRDYGIPPKKNGDYAFLLHIIRSLKSKGKGACILPHGVLFRGNVEAEIRTNIIRRGYIKGIIGLPANLFYGTGIPACIIVLDKENVHNRKGIFMIDASKGFAKDGPKNRLREQDIHRIVDVFNKQTEVEKYSRMVSVDEIEANEFNLNIPRYIDSQEPEDIQDIDAHLLGDIPIADIDALQDYWQVYPTLRKEVFTAGRNKSYCRLTVQQDKIKETIFSHPEFTAYSKEVNAVFTKWKTKNKPKLTGIAVDDKPKQLIHEISEDLLKCFRGLSLIDKYDIYQHLMTYWAETMQDDVYALVADGWKAGNEVEKDDKKKNVWDGRVIPKQLMIARYFAAEQKAIDTLETQREDIARQQEEMAEEHGGEEGLLEEVKNEKGNITKGEVQKRIKGIQDDPDYMDELRVLKKYLILLNIEANIKKQIRIAQVELDSKLLAKYKQLTETEIKTLVVDDKWLATMERDVKTEMDRISQRLTGRIKELADRYEIPLPQQHKLVKDLTTKVDTHLKKMGFVWK